MCIMESDNNKKTLRDWLTRCEAIAGSNSFPEDQVIFLRAMLLRAAVDGVNRREIYRSITNAGILSAHTFLTLT